MGKAKASTLPDNALAKKALMAVQEIDREAQQKKLSQLESLNGARKAIMERIDELQHQLEQLDDAIRMVTGRPAPAEGAKGKRTRRNLEDVRERVARWMEGRQGQKFAARELVTEFPELDGVPISIFLKPLVESGKVKTDSSEGVRRTRYYI